VELARFALQAARHEAWSLYWAAGIGTMGSAAADLALETRTLERLLHGIKHEPGLMNRLGSVALASSAGAIYAGSTDDIITEASAPAPTSPYAQAKLEQEALLRAFAQPHENVSAMLARITTIYGPGQATGKRQGLLAHMARSIVRHRPIQIFVPFDTIRDYIAVDDAAAIIIAALRAQPCGERLQMKIVGSEQPQTIAEIIATFKRIARRPPLIATSASRLSAIYSRRVQFRSVVQPDCRSLVSTSLLIGVSQLMEAERRAFACAAAARAGDAR
jgi:UDP-glucose 4-epimerase